MCTGNNKPSINVNIRSAVETDLDGIVRLISEMSAFYGSTSAADGEAQAAMTRRALFEDNLGTHVLVACQEMKVVGLASYAFVWPATGASRSLYLKDLYVIELYRSQRIGSQLVEAVKEVGRNHDCTRIDWTVDNSNDEAFDFYDRIGGFTSDKAGYRLLL